MGWLLSSLIISIDFSVIVSLLLITICLYTLHYYYKYFTRINPLPGPLPLPLFGNFLRVRNDIDQMFFDLYEKYGDIYEVTIAGTRRIVLCNGKYVEKLLDPSINNHNYMVRFPFRKDLEALNLVGKGLVTNYNLKSWRYNRQFFAQAIMT